MRVSEKLAVHFALYFFMHTAFLVLLGVHTRPSIHTMLYGVLVPDCIIHFSTYVILCGEAETVFSRLSRILCYLSKSNVAITTVFYNI